MTNEEKLIDQLKMANIIILNQIVAQQSAWIEWQHGKGAESAMMWIHNSLWGPGSIPDEDAPYGKDAQMWFNDNRADRFPDCHCGKPSHHLWMGHGACCEEHLKEIQISGVESH